MGEVAIDPAMPKNGLPQDRRLCTDGFIIRAQATIRAGGCRPRKFGEGLRVACNGLRAARANHVQLIRMHGIRISWTRFWGKPDTD
jgi:hypothetical protein